MVGEIKEVDKRHWIQWGDKKVCFVKRSGERFIEARRRLGKTDVCPLCKTKITPQEVTDVYLIISNQAGVPNRIVHAECVEMTSFEKAFTYVSNDYEKSKFYADWFDLG